MESFKFVTYRAKRIAVVDLADATPEETIVIMEEAGRQIRKLPPKSALVVTDGTHAVYSRASIAAVKDFANKNTPFVKASAVVGVEGMLFVLVQAIIKLTGRHYQLCRSRTEAMEWLIAQK